MSTINPTITDDAVEAFKRAWHEADAAGLNGSRVERGLEAAAPLIAAQALRADVPALIAEVESLRAIIERASARLTEHHDPRCDERDEDDPISCGWKGNCIRALNALDGGGSDD